MGLPVRLGVAASVAPAAAAKVHLKVELAQTLLTRSLGVDTGLAAAKRLFVDIGGARPFRALHIESAEREMITTHEHDQVLAGFGLATKAVDLFRHPRRVEPRAEFEAALENARRLAPASKPVVPPAAASAARPAAWSRPVVTPAAFAHSIRSNVLSSVAHSGWLTGTLRLRRATPEAAGAVADAVLRDRRASATAGIEWHWAKTVNRVGEGTEVSLDYRVDPARLKPEHRAAAEAATRAHAAALLSAADAVRARTRSRVGEFHTPMRPDDARHYQTFIEQQVAPLLRAQGLDVGFRALSQSATGNHAVVWFARRP